jgi:nucleotidyltransferase/DNA polymerase involved in DNA repair
MQLHKPNAQTTLLPQYALGFVGGLPVRKLPGCGWAISRQLQSMGIETVPQLRALEQRVLAARFGRRQARLLYELARGIDRAAVVPSGAAKSMSEEDSLRTCTTR